MLDKISSENKSLSISLKHSFVCAKRLASAAGDSPGCCDDQQLCKGIKFGTDLEKKGVHGSDCYGRALCLDFFPRVHNASSSVQQEAMLSEIISVRGMSLYCGLRGNHLPSSMLTTEKKGGFCISHIYSCFSRCRCRVSKNSSMELPVI